MFARVSAMLYVASPLPEEGKSLTSRRRALCQRAMFARGSAMLYVASPVDVKCDFRHYLGFVVKWEKKTCGHRFFSVGHLGGPNDSKSIGNQLLSYIGDITEIDLPNRVQLVAKLEHFVGNLPKKSGQLRRGRDTLPGRANSKEIH